MTGFVSLVGAGPWDPQLLTLAGRDRLARADVVIADYLVNPALLLHCRADVEIHQRSAGPRGGVDLDQDATNALMLACARAGKRVVRLKGGDPCMFGRAGEEAQVLVRAGIGFEMIPGVSSPIAAPECAGIPVTHRDFTPAVTFVSGWEAYDKAGLAVAWEHLARSAGTIVLMMGVRNARDNAARLIAAGRDPSTPAAAIRWGTRGIQRTIVGTLADIADRIAAAGLRPPAVLVVGEVVRLREELAWFEQRPLFGKRVVVTRASASASALSDRLAELGADVVPIPTLAIAPPRDRDAFDRALSTIAEHDGVIVTSAAGAEAMAAGLARVGLDARALAGRLLAVVGRTTASACERGGLRPDVIASPATSEGLAATLETHGLLARRWLHVRAEIGRDALGQAITAANGRYTLAIGYRSERPVVPAPLLRSLRGRDQGGEGIDGVCFASGQAARNFLEIVGDALGPDTAHAMVAAARIAVLGPVTAEAVRALGLPVHAIASAADELALADAMRDALAQPGASA